MSEYQLIKWVAVAIIVVLVILFFLYSRNLQKKRGLAMKSQADSLGYSYSERGSRDWLSQFGGEQPHFSLFSQGSSRTLSHVMTGNYSHLPVTVMDYSYVTGSGKNSSTKKQTVLIIDDPKADLPDFELRPENLLDKIGSAFGRQDINFPAYPQFSKRYHLKGNDEASVRSIFTDSVTLYFEQNPGLCVACSHHRLIFYRFDKLLNPPDIPSFLQQGYDIYHLFKV